MSTSTSARPGSTLAIRATAAITLVAGLRGALQSGLLDVLWRRQPCETTELARRAGMDPRASRLTLEALAGIGVVTRAEAGWYLTAPPDAWAALLASERHVVDYIETGDAGATLGDGRYPAVLPVIGQFHEQVAERCAPELVRPGDRVLELGAGTAPWSRSMLEVEATARAVLVELPPVAAPLAAWAASSPFAERIEVVAGDAIAAPVTGRFDVIVVSGLCRLLDAATNERLFLRCRELLTDGGRLVVCDCLADSDDPEGAIAAYALGLAARSPAERLWATADYARWLVAAGFTPPRLMTPPTSVASVLIATGLTGDTSTKESN